jgi:hypothetical protein
MHSRRCSLIKMTARQAKLQLLGRFCTHPSINMSQFCVNNFYVNSLYAFVIYLEIGLLFDKSPFDFLKVWHALQILLNQRLTQFSVVN